MMDINQLRTLVAVAELGSLSKAADNLCVAQPALSRHIILLEESLKTRLFDRHGRGMIITDQGRVVLGHALRILAEFESIKAEVASGNDTMSGHISIGLPPTVAEFMTVPLIAAIREKRPNASCRIVSGYSLHLFDWINRGKIDLAILYDPQAIRSLKSEAFVEEELYLVAPGDAGLTLDCAVDFRLLDNKPLLLPSGEHSLRQIADRAADECGFHLDVPIEVDSYPELKQLVASGLGWTILPLTPIEAEIASGQLSAARMANPVLKRSLELSFPADRPTTPVGSFVRSTMISVASRLVKDGIWKGKMLTR
jgi:LysR family nitrogen assimilation transcriptional regulator